MLRPHNSRKGNALVEFSLLGVPVIFITIAIISVSINMWAFHCLAYSTEITARYASVHGENCTANSNSCTITIGDMATYYSNHALALDPGQVIVKFVDGSGTTTCGPVNTCTSSTARFPSALYSGVGQDVKVSATYVLTNPLAMFWPGTSGTPAANYTVGATSRQRIIF